MITRLTPVFAVASVVTAASAQQYTSTPLGTLSGSSSGESYARGINDAGVVVGTASDGPGATRHAFRWTSSTGMVDLGQLLPPHDTAALDINPAGKICGYGLAQSSAFATGMVAIPGGNLTALPGAGGDWYAYSIDDAGEVVGWTNFSNGCGGPACPNNPGRAVRWTPAGGGHQLQFLPDLGGYYSVASGISPNGGIICGYGATSSGATRAFRVASGTATPLPPLAGYDASFAQGINNTGDVVGYCESSSGERRATLWVGATAIDLGMTTGSVGSVAIAINDARQIVGYSSLNATTTRGVLFSMNAPPVDLNTLVPSGSGWTITYADDINNSGWIVGDATGPQEDQGIMLTPGGCDSIDFNNDTLFPDTQDINDFLRVFSGGPCSTDPSPGCNDVDFNNDTLFPDTADIESLLSVFSGGPCL